MSENNLTGDEALEVIDIYMQSLNQGIVAAAVITNAIQRSGIAQKLANQLGRYNTMRGGTQGYKGFVFEELHAAHEQMNGVDITVCGDNGVADFMVIDQQGNRTFVQAKAGYRSGQVDWSKYKDQTIVVDKGNATLAQSAKKAGLQVQESSVSLGEAELVARAQQLESKLLNLPNAPMVASVYSAHKAGLACAKSAAKYALAFNVGANIYDVLDGTTTFEEASSKIVIDTLATTGSVYINGTLFTMAANTTVGATVSTAIASSAVGTLVTTGVSSASTLLATSAVGSTLTLASTSAAAGASMASAAFASSAVGTTLASTALGAAAMGAFTIGAPIAAAAAPFVAVAAGVGFMAKGLSKLFK